MSTTNELIQAADDIVWDTSSEKNVYSEARKLMFTAMWSSILPFKVHSTHKWAMAQADVHENRAKAFQLKCSDSSVLKLVNHHKLIASRYKSVAYAMSD